MAASPAVVRYALHDAAERNDVAALTALFAERARQLAGGGGGILDGGVPIDANERDGSGCTPLHASILGAAPDAVALLLSHGANTRSRCNGSPPLHVLISMGAIARNAGFVATAMATLLAQAPDAAFACDDAGRTALHIAAGTGQRAAAEALLAAAALARVGGAEPPTAGLLLHAVDQWGATALHAAAAARSAALVECLVGAAPGLVDATDDGGDTPAHVAARGGWRDGVTALRPTSDVRNRAGETVDDCLAAEGVPLRVDSTAAAAQAPTTLILTHEACRAHHTCDDPITRRTAGVPPENTARLEALLAPHRGVLRASEFDAPRTRLSDGAPAATITDVLRVHDYEYVRRILDVVGSAAGGDAAAAATAAASAQRDAATRGGGAADLPPPGHGCSVQHLDGDTAVSAKSWEAALRAAGAACAAVDAVVAGAATNAFCPVRPPGHHAGPSGIVLNEYDAVGTHGFCVLNNVAIAAAYVRAAYGRPPAPYAAALARADSEGDDGGSSAPTAGSTRPLIRRVAIFDFDVHHGNGTEAIVRGLVPTEVVTRLALPFARGAFSTMHYRPWLDETDGDDLLFVSTHGYGLRDAAAGGRLSADAPRFYPGSGASCGWDPAAAQASLTAAVQDGAADSAGGAADGAGEEEGSARPALASSGEPIDGSASAAADASRLPPTDASAAAAPAPSPRPSASSTRRRRGAATARAATAVDPQGRPSQLSLQTVPAPEPLFERLVRHPRIINVGMAPGAGPFAWRRVLAADVLPRIAAFAPDIIFISAGFDAHYKDAINSGYIGLRESDYEWVTRQLVKIANASCAGRIVSVLEGGYRVQGGIVSAFSRSVAAHVRALSAGTREAWDPARERARLVAELRAEAAAAEVAAAAEAAALSAAGGGAALSLSLTAQLIAPQSDAAMATPAAADSAASSRKRRRTPAVDYAALDAQMRQEAAARRAGGDLSLPSPIN